jgi:hypothetical protein
MPMTPIRVRPLHCRRCNRVTPHWGDEVRLGRSGRYHSPGRLIVALAGLVANPWTCSSCGNERKRWR